MVSGAVRPNEGSRSGTRGAIVKLYRLSLAEYLALKMSEACR